MSEEIVPWRDPTLHGPMPEGWFDWHRRSGTWRVCGYRLNLSHWRLTEIGEWVHDFGAFVPLTFPPARPDYAGEDLAKIEAAEAKRAKRAIRA